MVNEEAREDMQNASLRRAITGKPAYYERFENTIQFYKSELADAQAGTGASYCESGHIVIHDTITLEPDKFFEVLNHEYIHRAIFRVTECWHTSGAYDKIFRLVDKYHKTELDMGIVWTQESQLDWLRKKVHEERLKNWDAILRRQVSQ